MFKKKKKKKVDEYVCLWDCVWIGVLYVGVCGGVRYVVCVGCVGCGVWRMVCGMCYGLCYGMCYVCGVWCVVCGVWCVVCVVCVVCWMF